MTRRARFWCLAIHPISIWHTGNWCGFGTTPERWTFTPIPDVFINVRTGEIKSSYVGNGGRRSSLLCQEVRGTSIVRLKLRQPGLYGSIGGQRHPTSEGLSASHFVTHRTWISLLLGEIFLHDSHDRHCRQSYCLWCQRLLFGLRRLHRTLLGSVVPNPDRHHCCIRRKMFFAVKVVWPLFEF